MDIVLHFPSTLNSARNYAVTFNLTCTNCVSGVTDTTWILLIEYWQLLKESFMKKVSVESYFILTLWKYRITMLTVVHSLKWWLCVWSLSADLYLLNVTGKSWVNQGSAGSEGELGEFHLSEEPACWTAWGCPSQAWGWWKGKEGCLITRQYLINLLQIE